MRLELSGGGGLMDRDQVVVLRVLAAGAEFAEPVRNVSPSTV
jgi:hypothetical protein